MKGILYNIRGVIRNLPIRRKLLLLLFIQMLIPILVTGYLSYSKSAEVLKDKSIMYSNDILAMIEVRLNDYFQHLELYSQDILGEQSIYDLLDSHRDSSDQYDLVNPVYNLFNGTIMSRPEIQSLCLIDINKKLKASADDKSKLTQINRLMDDQYLVNSIAQKSRDAKGQQCVYLQTRDGQVENIFLARLIYSIEDYTPSGFLVVLLDKQYINTLFEGLAGDESQNVYIMNSSREIIVSNQDAPLSLGEDVWTQLGLNKEWVIDSDAGILVSQRYLASRDWRIISWNSNDVVFGEIMELRRLLIIINAIAIAGFSALSIYIATDLIRPIKRLVDAMRLVQRGDSKADVVVDRYDELGYLSKTFNTMVEETNNLVNRVYREQITKKDAEIKALQTQINPHFLFNTLESINWIARLNHVTEISEMITDLSTIMEASIGRGGRNMITLEKELDYIDTYINILKKRYGDRLTMKKEIEERLLYIEIPRLLIQPLIENAIYHGIDQKREGGEISIRGYVERGIVHIEVTDNGMGMTEEEARAINLSLSIDSDQYFVSLADNVNKSVGIENVNRRIKLHFGEEYGILIKSKYACYTKVIITFPYIPMQGRIADVPSTAD